jgi:hypothetical protein
MSLVWLRPLFLMGAAASADVSYEDRAAPGPMLGDAPASFVGAPPLEPAESAHETSTPQGATAAPVPSTRLAVSATQALPPPAVDSGPVFGAPVFGAPVSGVSVSGVSVASVSAPDAAPASRIEPRVQAQPIKPRSAVAPLTRERRLEVVAMGRRAANGVHIRRVKVAPFATGVVLPGFAMAIAGAKNRTVDSRERIRQPVHLTPDEAQVWQEAFDKRVVERKDWIAIRRATSGSLVGFLLWALIL